MGRVGLYMYNTYMERIIECLRGVQFFEGRLNIEDQNLAFERVCDIFRQYRDKGGHILFIGNGGSAAIAQHMLADFLKNGGMKTISLYNQANITCLGNDMNYEEVFAKQIEWLAEEEDLLVAISSSGNSPNIVNAIEAMRKNGGEVITLTGFSADNICKGLGDFNIYVPAREYGIVESIHNLLLQQVVDVLNHDEVRK